MQNQDQQSVTVRELDRAIGHGLFMTKVLRGTAWTGVAAGAIGLAADHSLFAIFGVIFLVTVFSGGSAILAEATLDFANRMKMKLAAEVARQQPSRTQREVSRPVLGAVYPDENKF